MTMSISHLSLFLVFFSLYTSLSQSSTSLYLSPALFFPNYQRMLQSFKIYTYTPPQPFSFTSPVESLFFTSLQNSHFITLNPEQAHLFFIPFPSDLSPRSLARVIRDLRTEFPYWNRTLGADHFYISCTGLGYESDRNLVELKKNSVQISCFPSPNGKFVPHKDITLPPLVPSTIHKSSNKRRPYKAFVKYDGVEELRGDLEVLIESQPSDEKTRSEFCLFDYAANISGIGEALSSGCVPLVITERPIQDLPLMDVLRWQEIAVIVGSSDDGFKWVKRVLNGTCSRGDTCERMRRLGAGASQHLVWNETPEPYDAFHMVMYQLWLRRHTIRYARREWI
ncbi:conserved hypothetical protein [Ricinus communis]|uniref:Exostosin GT47 domain-containing protein n=1 Tax=Ricinus communis TaxID=3988 RepID=B9SE16_RICCO|nr:conserved hypothetical protein [Ricinus communis]|eukprot:XP_002524235.1 probable glycosyltransferase At5g03795 [Ricinus communis]